MGAWIETVLKDTFKDLITVAPYMGAWIETSLNLYRECYIETSLPIWERGLKQQSSR